MPNRSKERGKKPTKNILLKVFLSKKQNQMFLIMQRLPGRHQDRFQWNASPGRFSRKRTVCPRGRGNNEAFFNGNKLYSGA